MAGMVACKAMLGRMGLNDSAQEAVVGADDQNLSTMAQFSRMNEKSVETLARVLRKPGGGGAGVKVSAQAEENLQGMVYLIRHHKRVCRTVDFADVTLDKVLKLERQREFEAAHTNPSSEPTIDSKDWPKTMELVVEWIGGFRGVDGHPLSYVIRDLLVPPGQNSDPTVGEANSEYLTYDEELIARGKIIDGTVAAGADPEKDGPFHASYIIDRSTVYDKLASLFKDTDVWPHMKGFKRRKDGRGCYRAAFNYTLGPNNVDHMASQAEKRLATVTYYGEKKNWNFDKYATEHKRQHNILEGLVKHGYNGIDCRSKVRFLSDGIKTSSLDSVKTRIMSDESLRVDFDKSVTLYKDFVKQAVQEKQALGIAALGVDGKPIAIEDKWYEGDVWASLSPDEQAKVKKLRGERKRQAKGGSSNNNQGGGGKTKSYKKQVAKLEKKVKNQKRQLAALNAKKEEASDSEVASDSESVESEQNQRNHSALTRQKKAKKAKKGGKS